MNAATSVVIMAGGRAGKGNSSSERIARRARGRKAELVRAPGMVPEVLS